MDQGTQEWTFFAGHGAFELGVSNTCQLEATEVRAASFLSGIALLAVGCNEGAEPSPDHSMVGVWIESEGNYRIEVYPDGKYRFCERSECFEDAYEAHNKDIEWSVDLKYFNKYPIGRKFVSKYNDKYIKDSYLQFNIQNTSLKYESIMSRCSRPLCIAIGDNVYGPIAVFEKMGNL